MVELTAGQRQVTDDLDQLLAILPPPLGQSLTDHPQREELLEIVLDLGRLPEARFIHSTQYLAETPVSREMLQYAVDRVGEFSGDNRAGIERTLHRISALRNRQGTIIGLTCRVGRAVFGTIGMIRDLVESGQSILLLGRPGVGKTTALREIARVLADELHKRVVIIDTSNEIAGDGDIPHPAIGKARRMQVARPELQHQVMIEAVENHMPQVIVIDEIGTELEALAARTIAERGVQLIGTAHGNQIENLMKNPTLSDLVGGIQSVTLGDEEARRRGTQKSVLERKAPPTFQIAVEMLERDRWVVHLDVAASVDLLLRGRQPSPEIRSVAADGSVVISRPEPPSQRSEVKSVPQRPSWRESGQMLPVVDANKEPLRANFAQLLEATLDTPTVGPNGEELPLHVFPYAVSRHHLEQAIRTLNLPIIVTKDIDQADVILTLRSHLKGESKLRHLAHIHHLPVHAIKTNSMAQIVRGLRHLLGIEDPSPAESADLSLFSPTGSDDELEALEEARLAVEEIVIPKGQAVELLPRSANIRRMQHELIEHYQLTSCSFGEEPNRRLRIYPNLSR
ncbi:R3H domain-containing nucleic acid-binding protein [Thermosynechococcus sp. HY213]|uniref:R3H domain-containing nucleic acid-binding protein n=1 Tax=Thermosynechococcus sp. HY213 TaxID=3074104 RepID=UPI00285BA107|nr:R3H domain-containing nucleic acid-binding protein [Thermosynechococcus sp. HY213]MDR7920819.1 R3H domain-containing nucleic acid-binding protein [Thermosynechococcus sp. HY213]